MCAIKYKRAIKYIHHAGYLWLSKTPWRYFLTASRRSRCNASHISLPMSVASSGSVDAADAVSIWGNEQYHNFVNPNRLGILHSYKHTGVFEYSLAIICPGSHN